MIESTTIKFNEVKDGVVFYTITVWRTDGSTSISGSTPIGTEINIDDIINDE